MTQELEREQTTPTGAEHTESRHGPIAQLLISWSPLSVILLAYAAAGWISAPLEEGDGASTNRLGANLHVLGPARADERLFGTVPTVWLQERLVDGAPHWYDAVAALVYVTHFVSIPLLTAVVWFCLRDRFAAWLVAVLTMSVVGIAGYVAYPAAPPWLAADGARSGSSTASPTSGWDVLHLDVVGPPRPSSARRAATRSPRCPRCTRAPPCWWRCSSGPRWARRAAPPWRRTPWRWH